MGYVEEMTLNLDDYTYDTIFNGIYEIIEDLISNTIETNLYIEGSEEDGYKAQLDTFIDYNELVEEIMAIYEANTGIKLRSLTHILRKTYDPKKNKTKKKLERL
jgi:hypothetical protein